MAEEELWFTANSYYVTTQHPDFTFFTKRHYSAGWGKMKLKATGGQDETRREKRDGQLIQGVKHQFIRRSQTKYSSDQNRASTRKIRATKENWKREGFESQCCLRGLHLFHMSYCNVRNSPTVIQHWIGGLLLVVPQQPQSKEMTIAPLRSDLPTLCHQKTDSYCKYVSNFKQKKEQTKDLNEPGLTQFFF